MFGKSLLKAAGDVAHVIDFSAYVIKQVEWTKDNGRMVFN